MGEQRETATERVDPSWTASVYQKYLSFWAADYLVWRSRPKFEVGEIRPVATQSWMDDPACEAAADAWAAAMDG